MDNESNLIVTDAEARHGDINEILPKQFERLQLASVLDDLTVEQYKSIFFLLMDYVGENEFPNIIKKEKTVLRQELDKILEGNHSIVFELFGSMKMYKKLKMLGTCYHVYRKIQDKFKKINGVWKMFYALCEEMTDIDLEIFKLCLPENTRNQIETAEEWCYWALQENLISKTDFTSLENLFHNYPKCLAVIQKFDESVKLGSYDIRTPTGNVHCGIAVILNYEIFSKKFKKREGSTSDVNELKDVWDLFGFETKVHNNLTFDETLAILKFYAQLDHSHYDAFVCCILSHGRQNSVISSDDKEMPIPVLVSEITDCVTLNSKPKLFFIQACQGICIREGPGKPIYQLKSPDTVESTAVNFTRTPFASDVLIAISSIEGYVSFRHESEGSFFIQALCKAMRQKGDKLSILDVMTDVNAIVRNKPVDFGPGLPRNAQQIANVQYTIVKRLIFKKRIK